MAYYQIAFPFWNEKIHKRHLRAHHFWGPGFLNKLLSSQKKQQRFISPKVSGTKNAGILNLYPYSLHR